MLCSFLFKHQQILFHPLSLIPSFLCDDGVRWLLFLLPFVVVVVVNTTTPISMVSSVNYCYLYLYSVTILVEWFVRFVFISRWSHQIHHPAISPFHLMADGKMWSEPRKMRQTGAHTHFFFRWFSSVSLESHIVSQQKKCLGEKTKRYQSQDTMLGGTKHKCEGNASIITFVSSILRQRKIYFYEFNTIFFVSYDCGIRILNLSCGSFLLPLFQLHNFF